MMANGGSKWTKFLTFPSGAEAVGKQEGRRLRRVNCRLAGGGIFRARQRSSPPLSPLGLSAILGLFQIVKINDVKRNFVNGNCLSATARLRLSEMAMAHYAMITSQHNS